MPTLSATGPITFTILNNSTNTTATINYFEISTNLSEIQHYLQIPSNWNAPFNTGTYVNFTGNSTLRSESKTYVSDVRNINRSTVGVTNSTSLVLDSNSGIQVGWTVYNANYITSGQTVSSLSGSDTVIISAVPNVTPFNSGTAITFIPPEYLLDVNNTTDLEVGWIASGNGYSSAAILEVRSSSRLVMDSQPSTNPTIGGTINFVSNQDSMVEVPPLSSSTFTMDYGNVITTFGTYTSTVYVYATQGTPITKIIRNYMAIDVPSPEPGAPPESPYFDPNNAGGGAGPGGCADGGGTGCGASGCVMASELSSQGSWSSLQKDGLVNWCENTLHNTFIGETIRRGYQILGTKIGVPMLRAGGRRKRYMQWTFETITNVLQKKPVEPIAFINGFCWFTAVVLTGLVVTKKYANQTWKSLYSNSDYEQSQ